jgi:glucosamine-6-phosphate deaminase
MKFIQCTDAKDLGEQVALATQKRIQEAIAERGEARVIFSTGASQFSTFQALLKLDIDWSKVEAFHLDEYLGIDVSHPASFIKYLKERFANQVNLKAFHFVDPSQGVEACISRLTKEITRCPIDIGLIGIGENGHIAFNDPPANFETKESYHVVRLDEACRNQQMGEGWFKSFDDVPAEAISMTVHQILACTHIISAVPYKVKAQAIANLYHAKEVSPYLPASAFMNHPSVDIYIDADSASLIEL